MQSGEASETPGAWGSWGACFEVLRGAACDWRATRMEPGRGLRRAPGEGRARAHGTLPARVKVELGLDRGSFPAG